MNAAVEQALALWGWQGASAELFARRENAVWRVRRDGGGDHAMRFHRPGYRSGDELRSELDWMGYLARSGLCVPSPVARPDGTLTGAVGDHVVSLLTWLPGRPLGHLGQLHGIDDALALCRRIGALMARLHDLSDGWARPAGFTRPDWRREGLLGETPLWGRFWDRPLLTPDQRALLIDARAAADAALRGLERDADQGLIHADMLLENILVDGDSISLIDFDDGAFGFRDFELATFLLRLDHRPDLPEMRAALCEGYAVRRRVRPTDLDLFLLVRALSYPGWIADRMGEPGADERSARAIATAVRHASRFLDGASGA